MYTFNDKHAEVLEIIIPSAKTPSQVNDAQEQRRGKAVLLSMTYLTLDQLVHVGLAEKIKGDRLMYKASEKGRRALSEYRTKTTVDTTTVVPAPA